MVQLEFKVNPDPVKVPDEIEQTSGAVPPAVTNACKYGAPGTPPGRDVVEMEGVGFTATVGETEAELVAVAVIVGV